MSADMSAVDTTLGQRVKRIREQKKIRQVDLAQNAGISWRHLIRIEQDAGGVTKAVTIAQIAEALDVPVEELTGGDDEEEADELPDLDVMLRSYIRKLVREEANA